MSVKKIGGWLVRTDLPRWRLFLGQGWEENAADTPEMV